MYGGMVISLRTLFDAMLGNYTLVDLGNYNTSHSILLIVHLIASNIFLLNYLIAILATVYEIMMEIGDFSYKSNKY